jgi:hypothetical protein
MPGAPDCEIHTLSQEEPAKAKKEETKAPAAEVAKDPKAAAEPAKESTEAPKPKSDKPVKVAPPAKNATVEPAAAANSTSDDEAFGAFVNASNGHDSAPRTKPICNGKNQGRCETHTLSQLKDGPMKSLKEI